MRPSDHRSSAALTHPAFAALPTLAALAGLSRKEALSRLVLWAASTPAAIAAVQEAPPSTSSQNSGAPPR
jgi:hypothetical protein